MTAENFLDWLTVNNCSQYPVQGYNTTGTAIKIVNNTRKVGGSVPKRYRYFQGPFGDVELPDKDIREICEYLWLEPPECVK